MTETYQLARHNHSVAFHAFQKARTDFRSGLITTAEFIVARKKFDAATEIFDAAFAAEENQEEPHDQQSSQNSQLELL